MSDREFEVVILDEYCKGCGLCVEFCDQGKLFIRQKPNKRGLLTAGVQPDATCIGCLKCAAICPDAAIEIRRIRTPARSAAAGNPDEDGP